MARTYRRDSLGRFAGGGGSPRQRAESLRFSTRPERRRTSQQPAFKGQILKAGPGRGTAKPKGTISGTAAGRSRDQFVRDMGGPRGAVAKTVRRAAPFRMRARSGDGWERSSAPRGTISASRGGRRREADIRAVFEGEARGLKVRVRGGSRANRSIRRGRR
jgi:hypothetical protein